MRLSVVVTIVDGDDTLDRCLTALANQADVEPFEVIVPWDDMVKGVPALANRFPRFAFPAMGAVSTSHPPSGAAGQHELYDRRRAFGLAKATGDVVALLEDRGMPDSHWARATLSVHRQLPHRVIGGAIENGRDDLLHWAVYVCDFGRFGLPFAAGARRWVSDINVAYKRGALEDTRHLWRDRYHETTVHWALQRSGETLYLSPDPIVTQMRGDLTLRGVLVERFAWGRLFAVTRAREGGIVTRAALAVLSLLLPALLFTRNARIQLARRPRTFLAASPIVLLLLLVWSAGEAMGYLTARA